MPSRPAYLPVSPRAARKSLFRQFSVMLAGACVACALGGCAAKLAYQDGKALVAQNKVEEGLAKFQEAMSREPRNVEYKTAYLQTRDRAVYAYVEQADRQVAEGKRAEADMLYQRVMAIDPSSERARTGLRNIELDVRHAQLLKEAAAAFDKKDIESAKLKLATVLTENPHNAQARALERAIDEKVTKPLVASSLSNAYKKPISIDFKDVALKQVFEVISRTSSLNFLFDKDVRTDQKVSIFLKNSTIASAVHFTLLTNQLEQQVLDANTILIYPNTDVKHKEYREMVVRSFFLANAEAKTVANTLKTILKSRDIVTDEKLNMLIVRDSADAIKLAEKLVALHDVPEPEVMLEVEILEVKRTRLLELGIQWPNSLTLTPLPSATGGTLSMQELRTNLNGGTIGAGIGPVIAHARKEDGDANLLANPRIRARNHEKAKILIGERVPNITTTATSSGFVSESINYVDVGLKLEVEPTIYLDNDVAIKVALEVSSVTNQIKTQSGSVAYQIGTRTASTVLRLKDGENQVLAGLINDEDRRSANKIPGFGELPVIGRLFGSTTDDNQKTEIVLSITPHLIRNIRRPDAAQAEFGAGTDSTLRSRSDSIGAVPVYATSPAANTAAAGSSSTADHAQPAAAASLGIDSGSTAASNANAGNILNMGTGAPNNAPPNGVQLQWQGPKQVKVGETFSLQLLMQSDQPVTNMPMTVGFDNKVLQVVNVTEGAFLKQGGVQTNFTSKVDSAGQITITGARYGGSGATSLGDVAIMTFRALASSDASGIQLLTIAPISAAGRSIATPLPAPFSVRVQP